MNTLDDATQKSRTIAVMGVVTMLLAMTGFCTCYMGFVASILLGVATLVLSQRALESEPEPTSAVYAYAHIGRICAALGMCFSALILALILIYLMVYFGLIFMAVSLGAMSV